MNCSQASEKILQLENPGEPDRSLQQHLSKCPSCSALLQRLTSLEQDVAFLSNSTAEAGSEKRARKIMSRLDALDTGRKPWVVRLRRPNMDRARQKLAIAVALVAILFTVAAGMLFIPRTVDRDSLSGLVAHKDYQLSRVRLLPARFQAVSEMIRQERTEARLFSQQGDTRRMLMHASLLIELVEKDVEKLIGAAGADVNLLKADLLQELAYLESDFQRLAYQHSSREEVSSALLQLARVSKRAEDRLRMALAS